MVVDAANMAAAGAAGTMDAVRMAVAAVGEEAVVAVADMDYMAAVVVAVDSGRTQAL